MRGDETPLAARIVHIADAYDAMTSDRPYRRGMKHEKAIRIIKENAGTQFDPGIVPVFLGIAATFERNNPLRQQPEAEPASLSIEQLAAAVNHTDSALSLDLVGNRK